MQTDSWPDLVNGCLHDGFFGFTAGVEFAGARVLDDEHGSGDVVAQVVEAVLGCVAPELPLRNGFFYTLECELTHAAHYYLNHNEKSSDTYLVINKCRYIIMEKIRWNN